MLPPPRGTVQGKSKKAKGKSKAATIFDKIWRQPVLTFAFFLLPFALHYDPPVARTSCNVLTVEILQERDGVLA